MLKILISAVFKLIALIGKIIITPIMLIVNPILTAFGFSEYTNSILQFLQSAYSYFNFFVELLHIPRLAIQSVFAVGGTILTFNVTLYTVGLLISIYDFVKAGRGMGGSRY